MKEKKIAHAHIELWKRNGDTVCYEDVDFRGISFRGLCMLIANLNRVKNGLLERMKDYDELFFEPRD